MNKKKNIAILSPIDLSLFQKHINEKIPKNIRESGGGTVNFLCDHLIKKKHKLIIITLTSKLKKIKIYKSKNLKIYILPKNKNLLEKILSYFFYYNFFEIYRIVKILNNEKPDIINAHFWYEFSIAAKLSGFPHLITGHDRAKKILIYYKFLDNPLTFFRWFCRFSSLRFILLKTKSISVVSNNIKKFLILNNYFKNKVYIIRNAASFNKQKKQTKKFEFNIVTIMNDFINFKNPKLCMNIFKKVNKEVPYAKLYMFGNNFGKNEKAFIWAKKNKLDKNIIFKGYTDPEKLRKFLSIKGNLLLNLSLEETHSYSCVDAFSSKVPVLVYKNCEGTFETIHRGKFGFFINSLNPFKITNLIKKLEANRGLIRQKANDAYYYALKDLNKKKIIMQYLNLYDKKIKEFKSYKK